MLTGWKEADLSWLQEEESYLSIDMAFHMATWMRKAKVAPLCGTVPGWAYGWSVV
jgi:hypothetical protein